MCVRKRSSEDQLMLKQREKEEKKVHPNVYTLRHVATTAHTYAHLQVKHRHCSLFGAFTTFYTYQPQENCYFMTLFRL